MTHDFTGGSRKLFLLLAGAILVSMIVVVLWANKREEYRLKRQDSLLADSCERVDKALREARLERWHVVAVGQRFNTLQVEAEGGIDHAEVTRVLTLASNALHGTRIVSTILVGDLFEEKPLIGASYVKDGITVVVATNSGAKSPEWLRGQRSAK